ncbi:MAG TPA: pyridoxamine 5'-phosphate oxidase family protein [Gaiellaceae bacterium]|nr:pyridoxamine 5'-phosphate oxidase family protein [Gaiellaceae bacterium]
MSIVSDSGAPRLPADVVRELEKSHLGILATASADGFPTTTLVSWLCAPDDGHVVIALDRRGLAFSNVLDNPNVALELVIDGFVATLRGPVTILSDQLCCAPFPSAALLLEIHEVRDHSVAGVSISPPRYRFSQDKARYASTESAIVAELREICNHARNGNGAAPRD